MHAKTPIDPVRRKPQRSSEKCSGHRSVRREGRLFWHSVSIGDMAHWNEMFCSDVWFMLTTELLDRVLHDTPSAQPRGLTWSIIIDLAESRSLPRIRIVLKWTCEHAWKCSHIWLRPAAVCKSSAFMLDLPKPDTIKHNLWFKIWNDTMAGRRPASSISTAEARLILQVKHAQWRQVTWRSTKRLG